MKPFIKTYVKIGILILGITLFFTNCQKDSLSTNEQGLNETDNQHKWRVSEYSFNEINKTEKFKNSFSKIRASVKDNVSYSRSTGGNNAFFIDSTTIKEIVIDNLTTYTMLINRDDYEIGSFENLVVEVDSANNTRAFIIKYYTETNIELFKAHNSYSFQGTREIKEINYDASVFSRSSTMKREEISCTWEIRCDYSYDHVAGANCGQTYIVIDCGGSGAGGIPGGGDNSGGDTDYGDGSGNETGGGSSIITGDTTTEDSEDPIITAITLTAKEIAINTFFNNLTDVQKLFLNKRGDIKKQIEDFLKANSEPARTRLGSVDAPLFSAETLSFAVEAVEAFKENTDLGTNNEVDFENEIIKDSSFVDTKADCVLEKLLNQTGYFKEVMDAFTNNSSSYKIKFVVGALSAQNQGADAQTAPPDENGIVTITIEPGLINKDALEIAAVLLHEGVHAQLHRMLASGNKAVYNLSTSDYNWLLELEEFWSNNSELPTAQHDFMTIRYVDKIASAMRKFDSNANPIDNYLLFGWDGLYDEGRNRGLINSTQFREYQELAEVPLNDNHNTSCD